MNDAQFDRLHEKIDAYTMEVDRFHDDVAAFAKQVNYCDKLIRVANSSLGQIDDRIASAVEVNAQAQQTADAAAASASRQATQAASAAVSALVQSVAEATGEAHKASRSLQILQLKSGLWIAGYATITLLCCLLTGYITAWAMRGNALTPEQANYVELGKAHEALINNANAREQKLINTIKTRPAVPK